MTDGADSDFTRERDVENKRIKPFLKKLGYTENEYQQQLYMEIGNHNHALIPDFVIHPIVTSGHQSAAFIIEAKLSISSTKLLEEAKTQASAPSSQKADLGLERDFRRARQRTQAG